MAAVCFGTLGPVSRTATELGLESSAFGFWRGAIATMVVAAAVLAVIARGGPRPALRSLTGRDRLALLAAATSVAALNLAIFAAMARIPIAVALVGFYTFPAMVALAGIVTGRESLGPTRLAALAMALAGMVLVVGGANGGSDAADADATVASMEQALGVGLALVAAAAQATYILISRSEYREARALDVILVVLAVSAVMMAGTAVLLGGPAAIALPFSTAGLWAPLLWAGLVAGGIPSLLFLLGIRAIGATSAAILMLLEPLTGVILAALLLAERLAPAQFAGGALILAAAVLLQSRTRREVSEPVPTA